MTEIRESKIYLNFFSTHKWWITLSTILLTLLAYSYQFNQPFIYHSTISMRMEYNGQNIPDQISLTDQAVSQTRAYFLNDKSLNEKGEKLVIYKSGPLLVNIDVSNQGSSMGGQTLTKVEQYLEENFPLSRVSGVIQFKEKPSAIIITGIGFLLGIILGVLISLIKVYFKKF